MEKINPEANIDEINESRIINAAKWTGKIIAATVIVCAAATPFVYKWADKIGENVEPVSNSLENVSQVTGDLRQSVDQGVPEVKNSIEGLKDSLPTFKQNSSTTSTLPKPK